MNTANLQGPERVRPGTGLVLAAFLYVWLMVGFFSGTAVLVGPVRWITQAVQALGWEEQSQNHLLKAVILLYVVASFFASRWLVRRMFRSGRRPVKMGIPLVVTLAALVSLWGWMNPGRMLAGMAGGTRQEVALESGAEFIFGAYPDRARLEELKREGVTALVSLQHPAVPIEVPGIAEERKAAAEMGFKFIHAPMLPWISDNEAALNVIRDLVRNGTGKYYVHCGLGRDRSTVVRRLVERVGAQTATTTDLKSALTFADRKRQAEEGEVPSEGFERGKLTELERDVWLVPHPNRRELFGYMLAGQVAHVVSLLDPADPEQRAWVEEQRSAFADFEVGFTVLTLRPGDEAGARKIAQSIRALPRPVAVIAPRTTWTDYQRPSDGTGAATTFYRAYRALPAGGSAAPAATAP